LQERTDPGRPFDFLYLGHNIGVGYRAKWVIRIVHCGHVWNLMKIEYSRNGLDKRLNASPND
jgi:Protein of unknown function (DUF3467)